MTMIPFPGTYHGERDELTGMFPSARLSLKSIAGPLRGQQFMFDGGPFVIGRAPTCTVPISSKGVSRAHAKIEYGNGGYWLLPEKTVNGTRLNGVLVQAPCQLSDGDQIAIYDSTFVVTYREPGQDLDEGDLAPPPPPAPAPPAPPPQYAAPQYPTAPQYPSAQYPSQQQPYPPQAYPAYPPPQPYPSAPPSYPTIAGAPPPTYPRGSLSSMHYGAAPAPKRWPVWLGVSAGMLVLVAAVVIVTVKLVEPTVTPFVGPAAATPAPAPQVAVTVPPPAPPPVAVVAPAAKPAPPPAPPPPPPAPKLVGVLAIEATPIVAGQRGTLVDVVAVGTAVERGAPIGHDRMFSPNYSAAYAKLVSLRRKYGDSPDYADFIAQAEQDFAIAKARRQLKPIAATTAGTVTKIKAKAGDELRETDVVVELAVARITVPVAAVDGDGKRCMAELVGTGKQWAGTMLAVGAAERTLELKVVPTDAAPGEVGEVRIHCTAE